MKYAQNPSEFADIVEYVLVRLFSFTPGAQVYYRQNRDPIIYVRIWKCANEGIMNNLLQVISDPETPLKGALVHEAMTVGVNMPRQFHKYWILIGTVNLEKDFPDFTL